DVHLDDYFRPQRLRLLRRRHAPHMSLRCQPRGCLACPPQFQHHPDLVSGLVLVREQIRIAAGLPLSHTQEEISLRGHAIECRINAEDPAHNFQPCPGKIDFVHLPGGCGVRVDTGLYSGYTLPPYYDSLMAKLIVWAPTRLEAIRRMRRVLEELVIDGPGKNR